MKISIFLTILLYSILTTAAFAQLSDRKQASLAKQYRRSMGLEATVAKIRAGEVDVKRLGILSAVLAGTQEHHIHNQRGVTGNQVFLHKDGHKEAVFGPDNQPVTDGVNDASYNYFNPMTDPLRHYFYDIHPWILMGNTRKDPTTPKERISSFIADLQDGILRATKAGISQSVEVRNLRDGEPETYAIFLRAIELGNAFELFVAIENQSILKEEIRRDLLGKIEVGLQKLYAK